MQAEYPAEFTRDHGCTEPEWLRCLAGAVRDQRLTLGVPGTATVTITDGTGDGSLTLRWLLLPPRLTSLVALPRLEVQYRFAGLDEAQRKTFMRYFDLYMLRGGG